MLLSRQCATAHAGIDRTTKQLQVRSLTPIPLKASQAEAYTNEDAISNHNSAAAIHDGRLPYWQALEELSQPISYQMKVLQGHKFAWGRSVLQGKDLLFVADAEVARGMLRNENELGIRMDVPETFKRLLGETALSMTEDPELHAHVRQTMSPYFTAEAVQRLMPNIQATVQRHMARWAAASATGPFDGYAACKALTFDVIVNQGLQIGMSDEEVEKYSKVFETWVAGFTPPAINLPIFPFGRGMKAREQLVARVCAALHDPLIPPGSLTAKLRDVYGPDSDIAVDNMITILFAGHDTTSTAISYLLWQLQQHPEVMNKLYDEQAAVQQQHGPDLTPAALSAMRYTAATVKETLRMARIVPGVLRKTTKPIAALNNSTPAIASGCPFIVATGAMSITDPAVAADQDDFKPERWLDVKDAKLLSVNQMPFGAGQHYCLGANLATAELTAAMTVLARGYRATVDTEVTWVDFPLKRPSSFVGVQLMRL